MENKKKCTIWCSDFKISTIEFRTLIVLSASFGLFCICIKLESCSKLNMSECLVEPVINAKTCSSKLI